MMLLVYMFSSMTESKQCFYTGRATNPILLHLVPRAEVCWAFCLTYSAVWLVIWCHPGSANFGGGHDDKTF